MCPNDSCVSRQASQHSSRKDAPAYDEGVRMDESEFSFEPLMKLVRAQTGSYTKMKPFQKVTVIVDHRETNTILLQALEDHPEFILQFGYLQTGDYQISNLLLIERKTCQDFSLSVVQGRLFRQATRLCKTVQDRMVDAAIFIVEGEDDEFQKININREAILGAMASVQVKFYLPVLRTRTPLESVKMMEIIYHQMEDENDRYTFPVRWGKFSKKSRKKNQVHVLQGLPGVGASRAVDLLGHFGSVGKVFSATTEELCQVPGVGKMTSKNIRKLLDP